MKMRNETIKKIRKALKSNVDLEYKEGGQRFSREEIKLHGVRIPIARNIGKIYFSKLKNSQKNNIIPLCEELLLSGYNEETAIAFDWIYRIRNQYVRNDFRIFDSWIEKYITNWSTCDDFCSHALGYFLFQFPEFLPQIEKWAKSKNRWRRRVSAVCLIYSLRKKKYLKNAFNIANILLEDSDDLVQKGYGWMLKEASNIYPQEIYNYVDNNKANMPRTALRYAIEKMPKEMKIKLMNK